MASVASSRLLSLRKQNLVMPEELSGERPADYRRVPLPEAPADPEGSQDAAWSAEPTAPPRQAASVRSFPPDLRPQIAARAP
jgi:hypothetical protein